MALLHLRRNVFAIFVGMILVVMTAPLILLSLRAFEQASGIQIPLEAKNSFVPEKRFRRVTRIADDPTVENDLINSRKKFVDICVVVAGNLGVMREFEIFMKSVILQSRNMSIRFHIVAGNGSEVRVPRFMDKIRNPKVDIQYEITVLDQNYIREQLLHNKIAPARPFSMFVYSKAFIFKILTKVDKCLLLDTDLVFGTDPTKLWQHWTQMKGNEIIMMRLSKIAVQLTNTGVMLMDFAAMRRMQFDSLYSDAVLRCKGVRYKDQLFHDCGSGEQGLYFRVYQNHEDLFHQLEPSWNLERCLGFKGFRFRRKMDNRGLFFGIAHLDCIFPSSPDAFTEFLCQENDQITPLQRYIKNLIFMQID